MSTLSHQTRTSVCRVRLPEGSASTRRFRHDDPLSLLFLFVDAHLGRTGPYRLVTQFPRRILTRPPDSGPGAGGGGGGEMGGEESGAGEQEGATTTVEGCGLAGSEVLMVEMMDEGGED